MDTTVDDTEKVRRSSWKEDILYLLKNKSFVISTIAGSLLAFSLTSLSWWVPHYYEDALRYRNETLPIDITASDPKIEK